MSSSRIPSLEFGNDGPDLLFLHANGYPPACYRPLLARLSESRHVIAMLQRPLWENSHPQDIRDWKPLSDDLLRFLDENESQVPKVVIGHSMGGIAALRAALHQPQRFKRLILLDPVLLPPSAIALWKLALSFNFAHRLHPHIASSLKRRREFDDLELVFQRYRRNPTFRYMDEEALRAYIEGITRSRKNGGYELIYTPEWESHIYYSGVWHDMDIWRGLPRLQVPTLIIRGAETDTFWETTARKVRRLNSSIQVKTIEKATHLVALERPRETFEIMQSFLTPS